MRSVFFGIAVAGVLFNNVGALGGTRTEQDEFEKWMREDQSVKTGKYLCISDYAVGITQQSNKAAYVGTINLPPDIQKFFIGIRAHKREEKDDFLCFSRSMIEGLKKYKPPRGSAEEDLDRCFKHNDCDDSTDPKYFIDQCLTYFETDGNEEYGGLKSIDGTLFRDSLYAPWKKEFNLFSDRFTIHQTKLDESTKPPAMADYIIKGRCEFVQ
jgi:hypothetical protein